jgi:cytochrome c oxidase subunit 1
MLFAIALVALFTIGGVSGVMHASVTSDLAQTDSYFIVAHFHYVLLGGSLMGLLAGFYYYYPKITGRLMDEKLGKWSFWLTVIGLNLTFFPMHFLGLTGMPRRTWRYDAGQGWELNNHLATYGAFILALGILLTWVNLVRSRKSGKIAGADPWGAPTLEWTIPSPPPEYNFARIPRVTSRYPLWDRKSPELSADVPHDPVGDRRTDVEVSGAPTGASFLSPRADELNEGEKAPTAGGSTRVDGVVLRPDPPRARGGSGRRGQHAVAHGVAGDHDPRRCDLRRLSVCVVVDSAGA